MGTIARGTKAGGGTNFNSGQVIDPDEVNDDFNTIVTEVNGALDDANIETATIPGAKSLRFTEISAPSSPSSNDLLVYANDRSTVTTLYSKDSGGTVRTLSPVGFLACVIAYKTTDETVNNSTTLQNDDALLIPLEPSEAWVFNASLRYSSGTTPDIKFAFTVPGSSGISWGPMAGGRWVAAGTFTQTDNVAASGAALDFMGSGAGTWLAVAGVVTADSSGNLQLQWAQNTANASDTKVLAGSRLQAWRVV
jgi:hypothetical protein